MAVTESMKYSRVISTRRSGTNLSKTIMISQTHHVVALCGKELREMNEKYSQNKRSTSTNDYSIYSITSSKQFECEDDVHLSCSRAEMMHSGGDPTC